MANGKVDEDILNARQHQSRQGMIDHRLAIDGEHLLGGDHSQGIEAGTCATSEDDGFHVDSYNEVFVWYCQFLFATLDSATPVMLPDYRMI